MLVPCGRVDYRDDGDDDGPGELCDNVPTWLFVVSIYGFFLGAGCVFYVVTMMVALGASYFFTW